MTKFSFCSSIISVQDEKSAHFIIKAKTPILNDEE
jgi:hypothetical protein